VSANGCFLGNPHPLESLYLHSHHGSTSVVELDGTLLKLGFFIKSIPAEVDVSVTEVTGEFGVAY